jgi:hypothetical protein
MQVLPTQAAAEGATIVADDGHALWRAHHAVQLIRPPD